MGGLVESRDKATAFASALKQLQGKGLSSALLQQIAEAGIDGGGLETAGALLGASSSEIQSLNSLQSQINSAATAAGKTTADAVYGAQIKAQTALVKSLGAQQAQLIKSMDKLASTMEKMIEKAFKGKASGGIVGAAASGGLRSNLTWVGEQGPELLDLPAGSRVWSNPDSCHLLQLAITDITDLGRAIQPQGEAAGRRIQRLCGEEGVALDWVGDLDDTVPLGPQGRANLLSAVQEACLADGGLLYVTSDASPTTVHTDSTLRLQRVA
ncbi:hypothetical protein SGLAM104S_09027 [Streptomyces glaucescens]